MKTLLYYRINPLHVELILTDGFIRANTYADCICLTRNKYYLAKYRPAVIVFDYDLLKQRNYKIKPICVYGTRLVQSDIYLTENTEKRYTRLLRAESEERVYSDKLWLSDAEFINV